MADQQLTEIPARQRLVTALAAVIARDGYTGSKIQSIAAEARVSLRTFYSEFDNKEACFLALHAQLEPAMKQVVQQAVVFDRPWREVIQRAFEAYFTALSARPKLTYAILIELGTLGPDARKAREKALMDMAGLIVDLVERGREHYPEIPSRSLTPLASRALVGGVTELVTGTLDLDGFEALPVFADTATEILWSVITNTDGE